MASSGRLPSFENGIAVTFAKNTAKTSMEGVCLGNVESFDYFLVGRRSIVRDADVCKALTPCGERCGKRNLGRGA